MKKKVLLFINYFGKASETFISDEIAFLKTQPDLTVEVLHYGKNILEKKIFGLAMSSSVLSRWKNQLSKLNSKKIKSLRYRNGLNASLPFLIDFFLNNNYDTIYCHFGTNGNLIAQLKELGVIPDSAKLVVRFHGMDMMFSKYPVGYYDLLIKKANNVIAGSNYAINDLTTYGFHRDEIIRMPVGIKQSNAVNDIQDPLLKIFKLISVGRLIEWKGHLDAISIIHLLKSKNITAHLTIVGSGELEEELNQLIQEKKLSNDVNLVGELDHSEVFALLKSSHLYLYPGIIDQNGRRETQGLANLEAMAIGLPILASNLGGIPDYVIDGETGFLCEPGNILQFAQKIEWIIKNYDSDELITIRKNAVKMVKENYLQEKLNQKLLEILVN
ncbi:glycosyltransferase family 4 protein [Epilithonimonas hominis]|uniref:glycosyltransferase family 4 protein n=1 Tax=Epilithonimonas hominis TaxID=420404 RepID=UPI0028A0AD33|nr:glycosyltransferase family 4 protein [Epilithonimonas hominis]